MQVTQIEVHEIALAYHDWIAYPLNHYYGPAGRTVYIAHTDDGRIGLGESGGTEPQETIDQYIGSNPFDWIGDETSLGLGTAMYDLMGQAAGVPVYKLFGQKYRSFRTRGCLDGIDPSPAHGRGRNPLRGAGLHLAEVPPLAL